MPEITYTKLEPLLIDGIPMRAYSTSTGCYVLVSRDTPPSRLYHMSISHKDRYPTTEEVFDAIRKKMPAGKDYFVFIASEMKEKPGKDEPYILQVYECLPEPSPQSPLPGSGEGNSEIEPPRRDAPPLQTGESSK